MPIFHRNAFSWEDDRRAAAIVSPRDSSVRIFSRYVASALQAQELSSASSTGAPKNVRYAAAMFEALRLYGISCVVVPATSYKNISGNEAALDNVSYPYQALYYRGGDCTYYAVNTKYIQKDFSHVPLVRRRKGAKLLFVKFSFFLLLFVVEIAYLDQQ